MPYRSEVDTPDLALSTNRAQREFFRTVNRLAPQVLEELRGKPLQVFAQSRASVKPYDWSSLKELTQNSISKEPGTLAIRRTLKDWAIKWHLNAHWVQSCACNTLETWRSGSERKEFNPPGVIFTSVTSITSREFFPKQLMASFNGFIGYEPTSETAAEFKGRFEDACKTFLDGYMEKHAATNHEYPKYPDKRKLELHLEWAVLYQVCEMNPVDIAHKYVDTDEKRRPDDREVRRQIHNTLKLIELEPRKPKRGG